VGLVQILPCRIFMLFIRIPNFWPNPAFYILNPDLGIGPDIETEQNAEKNLLSSVP
jgi:hypothetical protein